MSDRVQRAREIAALVRGGVRLQQPDALELAACVELWAELRDALVAATINHGTHCGTWMQWPCSCGLDAVYRAAR